VKQSLFFILLSLASRDRYGSDIQEDVRTLSDGDVRLWPATLYGSLEELAERGWIRELDDVEAPADGASRSRWYTIQPEGREALRAEVERSDALNRVARRRLGGERP
jgi:DNA-binding PadR family transcriptional regulator